MEEIITIKDDEANSHIHEDDEPIDPRIGVKLEELNTWTERINKLEQQFEEENASFRIILTEYSDKLRSMANKIGTRHVAEARKYYEMKEKSRAAQIECQKTVMAYEKSCQLLLEAKDEIERTESKFGRCSIHDGRPDDTDNDGDDTQSDDKKSGSQRDSGIEVLKKMEDAEETPTQMPDILCPFPSPKCPNFDATWQEVLNQSINKLKDAKDQKIRSKVDHENSMKKFMDLEKEISILEKKFKNSISKTKSYFNESFKFKSDLIKKKSEIEFLNEQIIASKSYYSLTLKDLENISEEIHAKRKLSKLLSCKPDLSHRHQLPQPFNGHQIVPELNDVQPAILGHHSSSLVATVKPVSSSAMVPASKLIDNNQQKRNEIEAINDKSSSKLRLTKELSAAKQTPSSASSSAYSSFSSSSSSSGRSSVPTALPSHSNYDHNDAREKSSSVNCSMNGTKMDSRQTLSCLNVTELLAKNNQEIRTAPSFYDVNLD